MDEGRDGPGGGERLRGLPVFAQRRFVPATFGFTVEGHPFLFSLISAFILIMGLAYLAAGIIGRIALMFLLVAAAGKLAFFYLAGAYWVAGAFPTVVPALASSDLVFALIFLG